RPVRAAALLALALALKPTAIVASLLFGALFPTVGLWLIPFVAIVLAAPFANPNWPYERWLYGSTPDGIFGAMPQHAPFNDIGGTLRRLGLPLSYGLLTIVRAAAALGTLALGFGALRRLPRPEAAYAIFSIGALYQLLFNPRTEGVDYIGLALVAAPLVARMLLVERRPGMAGLTAALCIIPGLV